MDGILSNDNRAVLALGVNMIPVFGVLLPSGSVTGSKRLLIIADHTKRVDALGAFALPIEVVPFGLSVTRGWIERAAERIGLSGELTLREGRDGPMRTDGGHHILDASFGRIDDPQALADALAPVPGVVEHGLFLNLADAALVAGPSGIERIERNG